MEAVARRLGWGGHATLQPLLDAWQALPEDASESNQYTAYRKSYLMDGAQTAALKLAQELGIVGLTPEAFEALDAQGIMAGDPEARDVILAAWKLRRDLSDVPALERWEADVVDQTLAALLVEA